MSSKAAYNTNPKSLKDKKISILKNKTSKNIYLKDNYNICPKTPNQFFFWNNSAIQKNLKKYSTSERKYRIFIINSIIFDHRIHKVAVFKNNLLWDESSEFLKRFYRIRESIERIPRISEYYEKYTLFPPVYFGFEGLIVIIMNKWTKRKKNYLEYLEDLEDETEGKNKKNKNISFEPLISPSLLNNKASSKSIISKNNLDLSRLDNDSNKKTLPNNKLSNKNDDMNSLSFSEIIDDLSSSYSIIINNNSNENTDNNLNSKSHNKQDKKLKKNLNNNANKKQNKKEGRNEINVNINKQGNTYTSIINNNSKISMTKVSQIKTMNSPKKKIKICLNKKNNKFGIGTNGNNIIKRNNNNLPFPSQVKKYQKQIMKTDNHLFEKQDVPIYGIVNKNNNNKGAIRVNTISNYITEKNQNVNKNMTQLKEESNSTKKTNSNYIKNNIKKSIIYNNNKKYSSTTINVGNIPDSIDKNLNKINYNIKNILKQKNNIQIKHKSLIDSSNASTSINNHNNKHHHKALTNRNNTNHQIYIKSERPTVPNLISRASLNKDNTNSLSIKDKKKKKKKRLCFEDPFIYKLTQLTKKKISLTSTNSLSKIKNPKCFTHYRINTVFENNKCSNILGIKNNNYITKNLNKIKCRKNLVLTKLNSRKEMIYDTKSKLHGEDIIRNNSASLHKNCNYSKNISNLIGYRQNNNPNNINLKLNLNIHFNIDVENKNKGKKIILNKTIINQLQGKMNKNKNYSNIVRNKDIIHQYPLTSKSSKRHLEDLNDPNKIEYTIFKNFEK